MEKRGISPLIATVLILGFTVALAAVIMTWGTGFTKGMTEEVEKTSGIQVTCATDVVFDVTDACEGTPGTGDDVPFALTIANNGNKAIKRFQIRFYASAGNVSTKTYNFGSGTDAGIPGFGIETSSEVGSGYTTESVYQIDAIPVIEVGGKEITCVQNIDSYGDVDNDSPLDKC